MSLLSVKREYWREEEDSVEAKIIKKAAFDDIAPIAVFLHADLKYEKQAINALKRLKKYCSHIPEIANLTESQLRKGETPGIDFGHIYNRLYEMIAEDFGDIGLDKYGAWGHIDSTRNEHFGDDQGFFPWYMDEETLRKDLADWNNN